eukprot:4452775-Pleurochrysis_carterae.AAC.1
MRRGERNRPKKPSCLKEREGETVCRNGVGAAAAVRAPVLTRLLQRPAPSVRTPALSSAHANTRTPTESASAARRRMRGSVPFQGCSSRHLRNGRREQLEAAHARGQNSASPISRCPLPLSSSLRFALSLPPAFHLALALLLPHPPSPSPNVRASATRRSASRVQAWLSLRSDEDPSGWFISASARLTAHCENRILGCARRLKDASDTAMG